MSKPAKRQKVNLEPLLRQIFIEACGGGCVNPGCTSPPEAPLQLGHIQSDKDGGPVTLDNLEPLCAKCNGGHKGFWPDFRPLDWRFRFMELWAQTLRLEPRKHPSTPCPKNELPVHTVQADKRVQDKGAYGWAESLLTLNLELPVPVRYPPDPYPAGKYEDMVVQVIQAGKKHRVPIPPPLPELRSKLMADAKRMPKRFLLGAHEFIEQEKWFEVSGQYVRRVMPDPWAVFHGNIDIYARDGEQRAQAAEAAAVKRAKDLEATERAAKESREAEERAAEQRVVIWQAAVDKAIQECLGLTCYIVENMPYASVTDKGVRRRLTAYEKAKLTKSVARLRELLNSDKSPDGSRWSLTDLRRYHKGLVDVAEQTRLAVDPDIATPIDES